jgi:hypothetical protein
VQNNDRSLEKVKQTRTRSSPEEIGSPIRNSKFTSKQLNESAHGNKGLVGEDSVPGRKRWITMCKR